MSMPSDSHDNSQNVSSLAMQCQQFLNILTAQAQKGPSSSDSHNASAHQAATLITVTQPSAKSSTQSPIQPPSNMAGIPMCLSTFRKQNMDYSVFSNESCDKSYVSASEWMIDTGATNHMVTTTHYFTNMQLEHNVTINLPNGQFVTVTHIGSIQFIASLLLTNVLCVPSFDFNLISVSKLTSSLQ
jgi:hypothetical protein